MYDFPTLARRISDLLWGGPVLILFLIGGAYLGLKLKLPQLRLLQIFKLTKKALKTRPLTADGKPLSPFGAFSTSLAAAVGTGSVTGVGAALAIGGRGALFWMWVSAFVGMGISYCENYLGLKHRGAVGYISRLPRGKIFACAYALFTVLASLGMGNMAQAGSAAAALSAGFGVSKYLSALVLIAFAAAVVMGKTSAAALCERLVPFMAGLFLMGSLWVIFSHPVSAARSLAEVFTSAFTLRAAGGGALGTAMIEGLRRGAFSNEAGLGSSAAVHSSCHTDGEEGRRALAAMAMSEIFIDTAVICTLTALVIMVSGVPLTADSAVQAYISALGGAGRYFITLCLTLFALATLAGWFYIGKQAFAYLSGGRTAVYCGIYIICTYGGAIYSPDTVLALSDIFNALMALPNMAAVLYLSAQINAPFRSKR